MPLSISALSTSQTLSTSGASTRSLDTPFVQLSADTPARLRTVRDPSVISVVSRSTLLTRLAISGDAAVERALPTHISRLPMGELDYVLFQPLARSIKGESVSAVLQILSEELLVTALTIERYPDKTMTEALARSALSWRDQFTDHGATGDVPRPAPADGNSMIGSIRASQANAMAHARHGATGRPGNIDGLLNGLLTSIGRGATSYFHVANTAGLDEAHRNAGSELISSTIEAVQLMSRNPKFSDAERVKAAILGASYLLNVDRIAQLTLDVTYSPAFAQSVATRLREYSAFVNTISHIDDVLDLVTARHNIEQFTQLLERFTTLPVDVKARVKDVDERVASAQGQILTHYKPAMSELLRIEGAEHEADMLIVSDNLPAFFGIEDFEIPDEAHPELTLSSYARHLSGAAFAEAQVRGSAPAALLTALHTELDSYIAISLRLQESAIHYHSAPTFLDFPELTFGVCPPVTVPRLRCVSDQGDFAVGLPANLYSFEHGTPKTESVFGPHVFKASVLSRISEAVKKDSRYADSALAISATAIPPEMRLDAWMLSLPVPAAYLEGEPPVDVTLSYSYLLEDYPRERLAMGFDPILDLRVQLMGASVRSRDFLISHLASALLVCTTTPPVKDKDGKPIGLGRGSWLPTGITVTGRELYVAVPHDAASRFSVYGIDATAFIQHQIQCWQKVQEGVAEAFAAGLTTPSPTVSANLITSRLISDLMLLPIVQIPDLRRYAVKPVYRYTRIDEATLVPCPTLLLGTTLQGERPQPQGDGAATRIDLLAPHTQEMLENTKLLRWLPYQPTALRRPYHGMRWTVRATRTWDRARYVLDNQGHILAWLADWIGYVQPAALVSVPEAWVVDAPREGSGESVLPPAPQPNPVPSAVMTAEIPTQTPAVITAGAPGPMGTTPLANQGENRSIEATREDAPLL